jgi:golgi phosphoprotein 3
VSVMFNDDVPDARDTLLLGLAESTGVLNAIMSPEDLRKTSSRIAQVLALEEINRSLGGTVARWRAALRYRVANANWDK